MQKFIHTLLKPSDGEPGLFGTCIAYYGMVEAQGRGMLHCHFLIWLEGNPNPQRLRDTLSQDGDFRADMFNWLEETIKCQLPKDKEVVTEPNGPLPRPLAESRLNDVRFERPPLIQDYLDDPDAFDTLYVDQVTRLVKEYNWHEHRETCWKHIRNGEPRDDTTCRMRINGLTSSETTIEPESGSIVLKRLHPRISNYNETLTFLFRSNNDIKYVGSGEAAKALVYYITDYVTKAELPVHAGLSAIEAAMQKTELQYQDQVPSADRLGKSLLIKSLNAIMARTELSHQQVMSYLVGGGDVYRSHEFSTLIWNNAEKYLQLSESPNTIPAESETDAPLQGEEMVNITIDSASTVSASND
ncbi:hypothetical protein B0H12DRAFT_1011941, partial [Mycena haematopus]